MFRSNSFFAAALCTVLAAWWSPSFAWPAPEPTKVRLVTSLTSTQIFGGTAISPSGRFGAVAMMAGIAIIDMNTGLEIARPSVGSSWSYAVTIDPKERYVAVGASDGLYIFGVPGFKKVHSTPSGSATEVKFSGSGDRLAVGYDNGRILVLDVLQSWKAVAEFRMDGPIAAMAISADGRRIAAGQGNIDDRGVTRPKDRPEWPIHAWSVDNGALLWTAKAHPNDVSAIQFMDNGKRLLTGAGGARRNSMIGPTLRLWDWDTGQLLSDFDGYRQRVTGIQSASVEGTEAYVVAHVDHPENSSSSTNLVRAKLDQQRVEDVCSNITSNIDRLEMSANGRLAIGISRWDSGLSIWQRFPACDAVQARGFKSDFEQGSVTLRGDGAMVFGLRNGIVGYDVPQGRFLFRIPRPPSENFLVKLGPKPDQFSSMAVWSSRSSLVTRNISTGEVERTLPLGGAFPWLESFAFTDDEELLAATFDSSKERSPDTGVLVRFSLRTGEILARSKTHLDSVRHIVAVPDRPFVLTASWDGRIYAVDRKTLQILRTYIQHGGQVHELALSPDGKRFAASFSPQGITLGVWRVDQERPVWGINEGTSSAVAWTADGATIVAGRDKLREYSASTGDLIRAFGGMPPNRRIERIGLLQGDRMLVANTQGGHFYTWDRQAPQAPASETFISATGLTVLANDRFDTSAIEELEAIGWLLPDDPMRPLRAEVFMRDFFEPRLGQRVAACMKTNPTDCRTDSGPAVNIATLNRIQPRVEFESVLPGPTADTARVRVKAFPVNDETQLNGKTSTEAFDLRLFRDGQLVARWPGGAEVGDDRAAWRKRSLVPRETQEVVVSLPTFKPGQVVKFTAYAFNEDRVKSATVEQTFNVPSHVQPRVPHAYVVAVGVDSYEDPGRKLHFAVKDARAMTNVLSRLDGYKVINVSLTSEGNDRKRWMATKTNIREVLTRLAGKPAQGSLRDVVGADQLIKATPDDLVIMTFSGHGHTTPQGRFYLLASDSGKAESLPSKGSLSRFISSEELSEWLRPIDSGQMALIIDACHSAASVDRPGFKPGPMGDRGLGQLAYDKAMRILAASQVDAFALESDKLKHGLLTYALIHDGMELRDGKRIADANRNGQLTLAEWLQWGERQTPRLYADIKAGRRGAVNVSRDGAIDARLRSQAIDRAQTPALFDFTRPSQPNAVLK